jgi:hypothetical protein
MCRTSLDRKCCPDTTEEFRRMIEAYHKDDRVRRMQRRRNQDVCTKSCDNAIAGAGTPNEPGYRERLPLRLESHHALRLCDESEHRMKMDCDNLSLEQDDARNAFAALLRGEDFVTLLGDTLDGTLIKRLGKKDASSVSKDEMKMLVKIFSTIFFPTTWSDDKLELDFEWKDWRDKPSRLGDYTGRAHGGPRIRMCAFNSSEAQKDGPVNRLAMDRLATILHELVHAYLDHYACRCAPNPRSFDEDVDQFKGHGRAWQRVAWSVEENAPSLIGLKLNLARFESIQASWDGIMYWPIQKELKRWGLKST